ncbi:MAG: SpoIID/LytB domain-containing protein [Parachlamydiales bacterium]|nr:SpoIID/LytB domain-containing protein [Parachlamydiales bacterium]
MKRSHFISFFIFIGSALFANPATMSTPTNPEKIAILLEKDVSEALLEVRGPYSIYNPYDGTKISSGLFGKRYLLRTITTGIKWGEEFVGYHQITIVPKSHKTSIILNGIEYEGSIIVYKVGDKLNIINKLDIESYLKATLPLKFPYPYESEVMAAVSIAARTTAYMQVLSNKNAFWHICASDVDYQGSIQNIPNSPVSKAVDATRDLILVKSFEGEIYPFMASWTEHSAGKTASYQSIFRKNLFSTSYGVSAPQADLDRKESKWSYTIPKKEFASLFQLTGVSAIETFIDQESQKTYAVRIKDTQNSLDLSFFDFQRILGTDHILSNDLKVNLENDKLHFVGYGRGHGVGLCLYSSSSMAQHGANAIMILQKFFPETTLLNLAQKAHELEK